jgi:hypothetical protein
VAVVYAMQREGGNWPKAEKQGGERPYPPLPTRAGPSGVACGGGGMQPPQTGDTGTSRARDGEREPPEPPELDCAELDWNDERSIRYGLILRSDQGGGHVPAAAALRARKLLGVGMRCDESQAVEGEEALLGALAAAVQRHDPDMIVAWDARRASIGYAIARAEAIGITPPLVRIIAHSAWAPPCPPTRTLSLRGSSHSLNHLSCPPARF